MIKKQKKLSKKRILAFLLVFIFSLVFINEMWHKAIASQTCTATLCTPAGHNTKNNCWVSLNNKVYDISALTQTFHMTALGGIGPLVTPHCGTDITSIFDGPNPADSNKPHTHTANTMNVVLPTFLIGNLVADTAIPTVTISFPTAGFVASPTITASGTASDNDAILNVQVKLNGGAFQAATGTNSWNKSLTLAPGSNTIIARATDMSSNFKETSVTVTYDVAAPVISAVTSSSIASTGATITYGLPTKHQIHKLNMALLLDLDLLRL